MKAEVISIGTELLMGEIVDTNASYLASRLPALGIELQWVSQVGDDLPRIREALERAWQRSDLTLTVGGLGPTEDDLTREAIAQALGEPIREDERLLEELRDLFARRGRPMAPRNRKQATLIPSAQPLHNALGTAPGWWVEREGRLMVALPGPPHELQPMWEKEVEPRLRERVGGKLLILARTLKTFGLTEASLDEKISPLYRLPGLEVGVYTKPDGIHIRLTTKTCHREEGEGLLRQAEAQARELLGSIIWGVDGETLEGRIGELLLEKGLTLGVMESCTGGLLASTITDAPGSSRYFKGGVIAYSNELKVRWGVDPRLIEAYGAVSASVAQAMARAVRQRLEVDIGIGVTGVAGPEGLEGKPPGTVYIGLAWPSGTTSIESWFPSPRSLVKRRAVSSALLELLRLLQKG